MNITTKIFFSFVGVYSCIFNLYLNTVCLISPCTKMAFNLVSGVCYNNYVIIIIFLCINMKIVNAFNLHKMTSALQNVPFEL